MNLNQLFALKIGNIRNPISIKNTQDLVYLDVDKNRLVVLNTKSEKVVFEYELSKSRGLEAHSNLDQYLRCEVLKFLPLMAYGAGKHLLLDVTTYKIIDTSIPNDFYFVGVMDDLFIYCTMHSYLLNRDEPPNSVCVYNVKTKQKLRYEFPNVESHVRFVLLNSKASFFDLNSDYTFSLGELKVDMDSSTLDYEVEHYSTEMKTDDTIKVCKRSRRVVGISELGYSFLAEISENELIWAVNDFEKKRVAQFSISTSSFSDLVTIRNVNLCYETNDSMVATVLIYDAKEKSKHFYLIDVLNKKIVHQVTGGRNELKRKGFGSYVVIKNSQNINYIYSLKHGAFLELPLDVKQEIIAIEYDIMFIKSDDGVITAHTLVLD